MSSALHFLAISLASYVFFGLIVGLFLDRLRNYRVKARPHQRPFESGVRILAFVPPVAVAVWYGLPVTIAALSVLVFSTLEWLEARSAAQRFMEWDASVRENPLTPYPSCPRAGLLAPVILFVLLTTWALVLGLSSPSTRTFVGHNRLWDARGLHRPTMSLETGATRVILMTT